MDDMQKAGIELMKRSGVPVTRQNYIDYFYNGVEDAENDIPEELEEREGALSRTFK